MKVTVGRKVQLDSTDFKVTKLAGKEIRLESVDGVVKYRRVATVERLLGEQRQVARRAAS